MLMRIGWDLPGEPTLPADHDHQLRTEAELRILCAKLILEEALETVQALGVDPRVQCPFVPPRNGYVLTIGDLDIVDSPLREPDLVGIADGCADLHVVTTDTMSFMGINEKPIVNEVDDNNLAKFGPGHSIRPDGKLIKPPNHQPPAIKDILIRQGWNNTTEASNTHEQGHRQQAS